MKSEIFKENIEKVSERYLSGESLALLAKEFKTDYYTARKLLVLKGIGIRTRTEALQKYVKYGKCEVCGREFRMRDKWSSTASHHRRTCSIECQKKLRKLHSGWTEERKARMSKILRGRDTSRWTILRKEEKPNWAGGRYSRTYRRIAFKDFELDAICSGCKTIENICVHHIDRDRTNNTKENLQAMCKPCHARFHALRGDCGVKYMAKKRRGLV